MRPRAANPSPAPGRAAPRTPTPSPATAPPGPDGLRRTLGPVLLTLYGIGVMVGAGIYVLVGAIAGHAGILAPLAFLAAGLIAAPTALSYAELSVRIPESAGEAAYVRSALGSNALADGVGLAIVAVGTTSAAAVLRGGVGYLTTFTDAPQALLVVAVAAALVGVAVVGVLESLAVAAAFTVVEVVGLLLVVWAGLGAEPTAEWEAGWPAAVPWAGIGLATVLAFFAFVGFEDIVNLAEEVRRPSRTLPVAIVASLAVGSLLYGLVSVAAVRSVGTDALADSDRPLALVYDTARGGGGGRLAAIAAVAALNGVLAQVVMASRVLFGLGRRNRRLAWFHHTDPRFATPVRGIVLLGVLITVGALAVDLGALAETTSTFLLAVFCVMNASLLVLKRRNPTAAFTVPRAVPMAGLAGSTVALGVALFA